MSRLRHFVAEHAPLWIRMGGRRVAYWGQAQSCVMCGARVRKFLQNGSSHIPVLINRAVIGGAPRANDRCPVCHSQDRTRLMRLYLETKTPIGSKPLSILHMAPDLGLVLWFNRINHLDYTAADLSARRYRHVPNFHIADITNLPFETARFDVAICSHVLEHVPDDRAAMAELLRVLKPGGRLLTLVPMATDDRPTEEDITLDEPTERERRFGQWDHLRLYHRDDFLERLRQTGFEVSLWDGWAHDHKRAAVWHLNPAELLPICRRPVLQP